MADFPRVLAELGVEPGGVCHVGAHLGEEVPFYRQAGFERIVLVEPHPTLAAGLRERFPDTVVIEAACSDRAGEATLHVMVRTNMSTIVTPTAADPVRSTVTVPLVRLDEVAGDANVIVIDAQGHELAVLAAAPWAQIDVLVVETCTVPDRTVASPYADVVALAEANGLREAHRWVRDYGFINRWGRGRAAPAVPAGEVRDVVFVRH